MTDLRTAAQQALEALRIAQEHWRIYHALRSKTIDGAIAALRAALAQQDRDMGEGETARRREKRTTYERDFAMTLAERISELVAQHGSLRAVARVTEISVGYLSRLRAGEKANPDAAKLRSLGLRRVVSFERLKEKNNG